jgi:hypothetical protein
MTEQIKNDSKEKFLSSGQNRWNFAKKLWFRPVLVVKPTCCGATLRDFVITCDFYVAQTWGQGQD